MRGACSRASPPWLSSQHQALASAVGAPRRGCRRGCGGGQTAPTTSCWYGAGAMASAASSPPVLGRDQFLISMLVSIPMRSNLRADSRRLAYLRPPHQEEAPHDPLVVAARSHGTGLPVPPAPRVSVFHAPPPWAGCHGLGCIVLRRFIISDRPRTPAWSASGAHLRVVHVHPPVVGRRVEAILHGDRERRDLRPPGNPCHRLAVVPPTVLRERTLGAYVSVW